MPDFMKWITSEDVYYIIVPIGVAILGVMGNYIMSFLAHEKQWKLLKERASADRYFYYFIKSFLVGLVSYVTAIMLVFFFAFVFGFDINQNVVRTVYIVCCIVFHTVLIVMKKWMMESLSLKNVIKKKQC